MLEFLQGSFLAYGYYFLFFGSLLEGIVVSGFFVPGGLLVLLGGYFARTNPAEISFWLVLVLSWIGMFLGDVINYFFGKSLWNRYLTRFRLMRYVERVQMFGEQERLAGLLRKWGVWVIIYSHVVGAFRSVIGFVAGASNYPFRTYLWASFIASFCWSLIFTWVGYFVAEATEDFARLNTTITIAALGMLLFILVLRVIASFVITFFTSKYVIRRVWQRKIQYFIERVQSIWKI